MGYDELCLKCFTSEIFEMTVKELRMVGKVLDVKFAGHSLKADLQRILIAYKADTIAADLTIARRKEHQTDQLEDIEISRIPDAIASRPCTNGQIPIGELTIKGLRHIAKEFEIDLRGKTLKGELQEIVREALSQRQPLVHGSEQKSLQQLLAEHRSVSNLRKPVTKARQNIDLYSKQPIAMLDNAEVDHIVETQMLAHCASAALSTRAFKLVSELSDMVNPTDLSNYNVCSQTVNCSKGQVVKLFLNDTDGLHADSGIRAKPYYQCYNHMGNITKAWIDVFPVVTENVRTYRRDGHVQNGDFEQVATQLDDLFDRMKLHDEEGIVTRSRTQKK